MSTEMPPGCPPDRRPGHGPPAWSGVTERQRLDLAVLRDFRQNGGHETETGYHCVFPHRTGFRAVPYQRRKLVNPDCPDSSSIFPTPLAAALAVIAWWRLRHGDGWPAAFRSRRRPAETVVRRDGGCVLAAKWLGGPRRWVGVELARGGYRAYVRTGPTGRQPVWPPVSGTTCFADRASAWEGVRRGRRVNSNKGDGS